jgi:hypothetical protein
MYIDIYLRFRMLSETVNNPTVQFTLSRNPKQFEDKQGVNMQPQYANETTASRTPFKILLDYSVNVKHNTTVSEVTLDNRKCREMSVLANQYLHVKYADAIIISTKCPLSQSYDIHSVKLNRNQLQNASNTATTKTDIFILKTLYNLYVDCLT